MNIVFTLAGGRTVRLHRLTVGVRSECRLSLRLIYLTAAASQPKDHREHCDQNDGRRHHDSPRIESIDGQRRGWLPLHALNIAELHLRYFIARAD
jgi:hypothetical protein